jgi:spermidine synthase
MEFTREYITEGEFHAFEIEETIYAQESEFQKIEIIRSASYGLGLFIDGRIQHLEKEEYLYSEIMVHPAISFLQEKCKHVACIGGGPGGVMREALKYDFIESIEQLEIDKTVIELSNKYLPHVSDGAFNDPRYTLKLHEAKSYLEQVDKTYDLIINDLNEPFASSPALPFFNKDTIAIIDSKLNDHGLYICWGGAASKLSVEFAKSLFDELKLVFPHVYPLYNHMQTYGTSWVTFLCSKQPLDFDTCLASVDDFLKASNVDDLQFFDEISFKHLIYLPKEIRNEFL